MWHGPSVLEAIGALTADQASATPMIGHHSVWALVLHIAVWAEVPLLRLDGQALKDLLPEEDFPPVPPTSTSAEWDAAKRRVETAYVTLADTVATLTPARLDELVVDQQYSTATMLHGVVEHGVYHAGQIMMLRRALEGVNARA